MANAMGEISLDALYTSPMFRTVQTARTIARGRSLKIQKASALAEIDYGQWVGKYFDDVTREKAYQIYHTAPSEAQPPGGEKMTEVLKRSVGLVEDLRKRHEKGRIALISHADVIKAILVRYLNLDLNEILRLRIDNASLSLVWFHGPRERVMAVNSLAAPSSLFSRTDQLPPAKFKK